MEKNELNEVGPDRVLPFLSKILIDDIGCFHIMVRTNIPIVSGGKQPQRLCAELIPSKVNSGGGIAGVGWKTFLSSDWNLVNFDVP